MEDLNTLNKTHWTINSVKFDNWTYEKYVVQLLKYGPQTTEPETYGAKFASHKHLFHCVICIQKQADRFMQQINTKFYKRVGEWVVKVYRNPSIRF